tara:strand:- start:1909 stop:2202 length:294 start_codon:yes stop_codon:yes gene_type:complete
MGSGLKKPKSYKGLNKYYKNLTNEEQLHFNYCINNNYRISPKPATQGLSPDLWYVEVRLGPYKKNEKAHVSPEAYDDKNIWPAIKKTMKFYYDKHTK